MHLVRPVGDIFKHWMNCLSTVCFEAEDGEGFGEVPAASNRPSAHLQTKAIILMGPLGGTPPTSTYVPGAKPVQQHPTPAHPDPSELCGSREAFLRSWHVTRMTSHPWRDPGR